MRRIKRARLAAEEALGKVGGIEEVEVADLGAVDADNPKETARWNVERPAVARRTIVSPIFVVLERALS